MASTSTLEPGSQLGRYELLVPIAHGGMAAVWIARQIGSHGFRKTVALKTMLPELADDPQFERMFQAEARNATRVHHPNVAETLDLGEEAGVVYLVMEWVDGETVSTLMKASEKAGYTLPFRLVMFMASRACAGLHAAHEVTDDDDAPLGLVHRDVSPQNVMVTYDGQIKVVDFGVSKSHGEGGATVTGQLKGKIPYMAPEQALGGRVDRRTDIFAMGTMLYRLTVGTHPFGGTGNQVLTLRNILHATPTLPSELFSDYPLELEAIVMRCLEKDPDKRFSTMAEVAQALDEVLAGLGPVSEQELSTFVEQHVGELRTERRSALREAARKLGWALGTSDSLPRLSLSGLSLQGPTSQPTPGAEPGPPSNATAGGPATGPPQVSLTPSSTQASAAVSKRAGVAPASRWGVLALLAGLVVLTVAAGVFIVHRLTRPVTFGDAATAAAGDRTGGDAPDVTASASASTRPTASAVASSEPTGGDAAPSARPSARPRIRGGPRSTASASVAPGWQTGPDLGF